MKKLFISVLALSMSLAGFSQDIYQVAELSTTDLNGTARYVGMGGAMGALGGDLSTMASNPAAIGLYRRSDMALTGSLVVQPGANKFDGEGNKHASFDQAGFVYSMRVADEGLQFLNLGVNYRKQRDFNQLVNSVMDMSNARYASQTWQLSDLCNFWRGSDNATPLAYMARKNYLIGDKSSGYSPYDADATYYSKWRKGSNSAIDFNLSTNIDNQFYIGLTATVYNVEMKSYTAYGEDLIAYDADDKPYDDGVYDIGNECRLTGTGYDMKLGVIVRPIFESNFKIGLSLTTPTYYDLRYRNNAWLSSETSWGKYDKEAWYDYDYKIRTPWKVNLSMGNTFFDQLALGVEYEFADRSSSSVSYGDSWDSWDGWYDYDDEKDHELNRQIDKYLKGTHTIKAGMEWNIANTVFVRGGYNHVTSAFDKDAYLNQFINSASIDAATYTDFMNLSAINRYTAGIGFKVGGFYADVAWQYQNQHGNLYTFYTTESGKPNEPNLCPRKRINLNKSQIMMTLGYRF